MSRREMEKVNDFNINKFAFGNIFSPAAKDKKIYLGHILCSFVAKKTCRSQWMC
jgi:hypothetical protein